MVTVLTGENSYALQQELRRLTSAFVEEHGDMALERLDGEAVSFERLQEALTGLPFLASKKLVVLRSPSAHKQFNERIETLISQLPETTDVIIVEPRLDKRLSYYKYLKKSTEFKEFSRLEPPALTSWLMQTARARQGSLSPADARYLLERVGTDQQLLANELEKLLLYNPKITRDTINLLTEPLPQSTIFQLLDAGFSGNKKKALELYAEQRALKVEPQQIIAMLTWQLHLVALLKTAGERSMEQIAKEAKLSPYVLNKSSTIARRLSYGELKRLVARLQVIDIKSKTTTFDLDDALQHYLLALVD